MESVAIISDIHGNMTALEAVLQDIHTRRIKKIYCLGDLVGKGPQSRKAIDRIKESCDGVVLGNWDDFIQNPTDIPEIMWHQEQLGEDYFNYLASLPFHIDFYMSGKYVRLFHASAKSVHHRFLPWVHSVEEKLAMFSNTEHTSQERTPDVVVYGDIHAALILPVRPLGTLVNVGSVGNPLDLPQATYGILHGEFGKKDAGAFSVEIARVPYDIEEELTIAKRMEMPALKEYEIELRNATYRGGFKAGS